jgi:hypothetical protein
MKMFSQNRKIAIVHGTLLLLGSLVGFVGRYIQFSDLRLTALIPRSIGISIIILANVKWRKEEIKQIVVFLIILIFGIILTWMALKFIFQDFQPLRKKINFPVMALSSIIAIVLMSKNYFKSRKQKQE